MQDRRAKVLLDMSFLASPLTGVGHYSIELVRALLEQKDSPELEALLTSQGGYQRERLHPHDFERHIQHSIRNRENRSVWQHRFGAAAARLRFASSQKTLIHALNYFHFLGRREATIPVIYDMSIARHPELHPPDRVRYFNRNMRSINAAPMVHTLSEFSRREIVAITGLEASRIQVIPPGHNHILRGPVERLPIQLQDGKPYLLVVGAHDPRKNVGILLEALASLSPAERQDIRIVFAGANGWGQNHTIKPELAQHIVEINNPTSGQLRGLYAQASGLLFPSLYEGFGMPVLEALAHGLPVAVAANTAASDVAEGICFTAATDDPTAWAKVIIAILSLKASERALHEARARERANHFTWSNSAKKTLELYQDVSSLIS